MSCDYELAHECVRFVGKNFSESHNDPFCFRQEQRKASIFEYFALIFSLGSPVFIHVLKE